jgi:phosphoribosylformylglycinamidine synthase
MPIKAKVFVSLKRTVLDPQGATIANALRKMQYRGVEDVRQGKYFELTFNDNSSRDAVQMQVERIAREVLTNPVIEEFTFTLDHGADKQ